MLQKKKKKKKNAAAVYVVRRLWQQCLAFCVRKLASLGMSRGIFCSKGDRLRAAYYSSTKTSYTIRVFMVVPFGEAISKYLVVYTRCDMFILVLIVRVRICGVKLHAKKQLLILIFMMLQILNAAR